MYKGGETNRKFNTCLNIVVAQCISGPYRCTIMKLCHIATLTC